jgi:TonB family protein
MASPAEISQNLPDTLPEDFGGWDDSESPSKAPAEVATLVPRETALKETQQKESARREAEAVDSANGPFASREVSSEYETSSNIATFPEPDLSQLPARGYPAPAVRAPRTSPAPSPLQALPASSQDESVFLRRMKSIDTVVDKLPANPAKIEDVAAATVTVIDRRPDTPLFSSIAAAAEDADDFTGNPRLLNELIDEEEERKARRKWILSGSVFGGALLLVVFQLFHYGTVGKLKQIVPVQQTAAAISETDALPDTISDKSLAAAKPSPAKQNRNAESQTDDAVDSGQSAATPAPAQTEMMQTQLMAPSRLPQDAKTVKQNDTPPPPSIGGASMDALNGNNSIGSVFASRSGGQVAGPKVVTVSAGVAVGLLTHKTQPAYPAIARSARVQGTVVLLATISKFGTVTNLKVQSGPPMLRQAAIDAVKTWQYKPYLLNNTPTDVDTTVNVVFSLGG